MNILLPDSWLREYLDTDATPAQLKEYLSLCGPSVEKINKVGDDAVYEIEITTNRVDMVSVYGIAREAAAILPRFGIKAKLKTPRGWQAEQSEAMTPPMVKESDKLPMTVSDPQKICNRIMGIVLEVDTMKPSPIFVKERLEKSDVRSLNNLVDITNYVMLELGHPCHVFDYDRIKTHKFILRFAKKGEPIITLDNKKYLLSSEDVIIDDGTGRVIDLPGIMGTENSVVNQNTKRIFFFIESNNPALIRKTSVRYGIRTMAAAINEKHPDPELVKTALLRGIELYQKIAGGKVAGEVIDIYPNPPKPRQIKVTPNFINERLGIELKTQEIIAILQTLGFTILQSEQPQLPIANCQLPITPPTFRQFDVTIPEDIVEEVARIYGYHNLPSSLMTGEIPVGEKPKILPLEEKIKQLLKYWGHTEVYNYSFISKDIIEKAKLKTSDHLRVANPLTVEIEYMRISLVPSMVETIAENQTYSDNLQLFELANVYLTPRGWQAGAATKAMTPPMVNGLPNEIPMLSITNQRSFYELKGTAEELLKQLDVSDTEIIPAVTKESTWLHFWHPQQSCTLIKNGKIIANIGKIHPSLSQNFQLKNDLYLAVLNVEMISNLSNPVRSYTPIPLYPAVIEDITISYPPKTYVGPVISEIYKVSKLIKNVEMIGRYKNSTTLRITYQDPNKNLESGDVKKVRTQILQTLKGEFNCSLKE